jgi:hypothetical protein
MKFLNTLLIILTLTGCQFIAPNKQKKWESISIKEKRALYEKVNKNKSSYKLQDFINEFGPPIDSIDYKLKFTNEIIEYNGLLAPNVESMKEYENYVKLIDPIRKKLYKKYKYEEETNVYRLRKGYYKAMAQYEFKYKESRQDRLTRIKKMLPNWEDIYIDDQKYSDLYDNTSDNYLSSDLRYQNCIRYDFALAEQITRESVYGTSKGDRDAKKSINTFGYVLVDENNDIRFIDGYYKFDVNENSATEKENKQKAILFGTGLVGLILFVRIRAKRRFKKLQAKELLFLDEILNDARSLDMSGVNLKYLRLNKLLLRNTGSEPKYTEIENRIKYTMECTLCDRPNFIQSSIVQVDTNTRRYMSNGRRNKDGSLDKRYNTEYSYSTTYYYKAHCEYCKKDFDFSTYDEI